MRRTHHNQASILAYLMRNLLPRMRREPLESGTKPIVFVEWTYSLELENCHQNQVSTLSAPMNRLTRYNKKSAVMVERESSRARWAHLLPGTRKAPSESSINSRVVDEWTYRLEREECRQNQASVISYSISRFTIWNEKNAVRIRYQSSCIRWINLLPRLRRMPW